MDAVEEWNINLTGFEVIGTNYLCSREFGFFFSSKLCVYLSFSPSHSQEKNDVMSVLLPGDSLSCQ